MLFASCFSRSIRSPISCGALLVDEMPKSSSTGSMRFHFPIFVWNKPMTPFRSYTSIIFDKAMASFSTASSCMFFSAVIKVGSFLPVAMVAAVRARISLDRCICLAMFRRESLSSIMFSGRFSLYYCGRKTI